MAQSKSLVDEAWTRELRPGLRRELLAQTLLLGSPEHLEIKARFARKD